MTPDVTALLQVQDDDLRIYALEDQLEALAPRLGELETERQRAEDALAKAREAIHVEEKRQRDVQDRLRQHREQRDKSEALLGQVATPREAAAAMAQIEQAKRFIADEERELETIGQRLAEQRKSAGERDTAVAEMERVQQETRASLASDRARLEEQLGETRSARESKARDVPRALLQRYDRIRQKRRSTAIFPLRGQSCAHCDTAIPVQRRSTMAATGATELCEGCGVMLYVAE